MSINEVYHHLFAGPSYNNHKGDEIRYEFVLKELRSQNTGTLIDISSGRGCFLDLIPPGVTVTSTDIEKFHTSACEFVHLDLTDTKAFPFPERTWNLLSCLDVLEHIPMECLDEVLLFLRGLAKRFCFSIANHPDVIGGVELHLIQQNQEWWDQKLRVLFDILSCETMYDNKLYQYVLSSK